MTITIYDNCPDFKAVFSTGEVITRDDMTFTELCDMCDVLDINKEDITIYNNKMELVYL